MKAAGILALVLAAVLGYKTYENYLSTSSMLEFYNSPLEMQQEGISPKIAHDNSMAREKLESEKRDETLMGIASAFSLIAGFALLSAGWKTVPLEVEESSYPVAQP